MTEQNKTEQISDFQKVRELLLGDASTAKIDALSQDDVAYIAGIISEAINLRSHQDNSLNEALAPVFENVFERSVTEDPQKISDAFFPIIGPAIRKSVAAALFDMVRTLNQLLEQSLSVKNLSWRYQAWRSGKNYAEYVLLKTLQYRVEQVFLIHRETGILINSAVAPEVVIQDPDLVSSMLTAINDFVSDSFEHDAQSLEWLKFGELSLQITLGPKAIIAVAIRGNAAEAVSQIVTQTIEKIHDRYYAELEKFDGDKESWHFISPMIEACLLSQSQEQETKQKKKPWFALIVIFAVLCTFGYYQFMAYKITQKQNNIISLLDGKIEYSIISKKITSSELNLTLVKDLDTKPFIDGIKNQDKLGFELNIKEISLPLAHKKHLLPYIHALTNSPQSLNLKIDNNKLYLIGQATQQQIDKITANQLILENFESIDSSKINLIEVDPNIVAQNEFKRLYNQVNGSFFVFEVGATKLHQSQYPKVIDSINTIKQMNLLAVTLNKKIEQITLMGFSDASGSNQTNKRLSLNRAIALKQTLVANGLDPELVAVFGAGHVDKTKLSQEKQRSVSLMIYYSVQQQQAKQK